MPRKRQSFKKIALLTTVAAANMSTFQQVAIAVSLDSFRIEDWNQFVGTEREKQRALTQTRIINTHSNHIQHANTQNHSNSGGHSNSSGHNNSNPHTNNHTNIPGTHTQNPNTPFSYPSHTNGHGQGWNHINNQHYQGHWNIPHRDNVGHAQGTAHSDRYTQVNTHSEHTQHGNAPWHTNDNNHSNWWPHTNNTPHSNSGFTHDNFVPSPPTFFDLQENKQLFGTAVLGIYSYDRNTDGHGTQEVGSRTSRFDLSIRRIQNLNGTANVSSWRALLTDVAETAVGETRINLNTIDPLGIGNTNAALTEGVYEIRAIARNAPISGVTFQSAESIVQVRIQQNHIPEIIVQNGSEFINFTFGHNGALSPAGIFSTYQAGLFIDATAAQQEGILVRFNMRDADTRAQTTENWQRGRVYLSRADNTEIIGTSVPIVWENGLNIISSENTLRGGLGFIPRSTFTSLGDLVGLRVTIEVQDFRDAEATVHTGTTVTQRIVSITDTRSLTVNVDVTAPTVTASPANTVWRNTVPTVTLTYSDATTSVAQRQFLVTNSATLPTSGWQTYTAPVSIGEDGERHLHFRAVDALGNVRSGTFGPYRLDRVAPSIVIAEAILAGNQTRITATATDALSGIAEIRVNGPAGNPGPWVSTVSPLVFVATLEGNYTFIVRDNAGNTRTVTHNVIFNPVLHGLTLNHIVRPPAGTLAPVSFPRATPLNINAGYRMTFRVDVSRASSVELRLFVNGQPHNILTDAGPSPSLTRNTSTIENTFVDFAFWVDRNTPRDTVLDMQLILRRDGRVITDNARGDNFARIVGTSRAGAGINLIR